MKKTTRVHEESHPYVEVGERLRQFAKEKFGSVSGLCRAINRQQTFFIRILAGEYLPGSSVQTLLRDVGCDVEWLITGKKSELPEALPEQLEKLPEQPETLPERFSTLPEEIEDRILTEGPTIEDFHVLSLELSRALRRVEDLKKQLSNLNRKYEDNDSNDKD